jgi:hypothetical protein
MSKAPPASSMVAGSRVPISSVTGRFLYIRVAEIALNRITQEVPELGGNRLVKMELFAELLNFAGRDRSALAHHDVHRVTRRHADEDEDDDGHAEHDRQGVQHALDDLDSSHVLPLQERERGRAHGSAG